MEHLNLPLKALCQNKGQIEGLPVNPRQWTAGEVETLAASIEQTPELLEARGIVVTPLPGKPDKYIILGGNMRYDALKKLKAETAPCIVVPAGTPVEKLREIVIKDNGSFGKWDYDMLANEWDDLPLTSWGVPAWDTEEEVSGDQFGEEFSLADGDKQPFQQITFMLADSQAEEIRGAIEEVKALDGYKTMITNGNTNGNGNALAFIVEQWIESRK